MSIRHHLSDELLLDYSAGTLAEGWSLAVATHLALCPSCRRRHALMEATGGEMLRLEVAQAASDISWAQMRQRLSTAPPVKTTVVNAPVSASASVTPILPEPLRSYLGGDLAALKWRPLGRGAYHIPIPVADNETKVRLLRIPAGKPVPEHSHGGRELTLVLEGSFADGQDLFCRGDIEEADASLTHQPVASADRDCICLAVTDAPLKFQSLLMRMVQPLIGI
ncbi:MAG: ChrR family anti-sigma-E factor [Allorhizobium sp.]